jgi:urease accessory protein
MAADVPHPAFAPYVGEPVPQAAPGSPGKDGRLELTFARTAEGTRLVRDFAQAPFHISGTLDVDPIDDAATVVVQSPTGGIAQGDRREVTVEVGPDAIAHVGTSASTKVYSMECNYARTDVSLRVDAGGHLEYLPEPTILHPDSRYCESVTLEVAADATAVLGEIVVPGRLARGEAFDFDRYYGRTEVRGPDGLLAADAVHLDPEARDPQVQGVLGDASVVGTTLVVAPGHDEDRLSDAIHDALHPDHVEAGEHPDLQTGATALPNGAGVLVRAVGETSDPVRHALRRGWGVARDRLRDADLPAPRR